MNELFVSVVSPEKVLSGKFRVHAVKGDEMEPKLRGGRDYVLAAPATSYEGEGLYLIDTGLGMELYQDRLPEQPPKAEPEAGGQTSPLVATPTPDSNPIAPAPSDERVAG